ncbi:hypothetical protein ZWY2020_037557 [Hordeum vulgare]|nr:hypothetical protein ZWY2020_037557 [Hordeum vulgare]
MADGPATHSWEDCYVMREFRAEAIKKGQSGDPDQRQEQFGAPNQCQNPFGSFPEPGAQGGSQPSSGQYPMHHQQQYNPPGVFQQPPLQGASQGQDDNGGFRNNPKQLSNGQYHIFTTNACRHDKKVSHRAYGVSEPALPRYHHWSEQTISWSREDHPPRVDNPDDLALVVAPQVGGYTLSKVLMDGGSSINILYFDTFQRMNLLEKDLMPTTTVFHGIIPGKSSYPIGQVRLTVAFGTTSNYRNEADEAFEALKRQLVNPPDLAAPTEKEPMLLYIAANSKAVSVAVVVERKEEGKEYPVQRPVYFISEVLTLSKQR